MPGKIRINFNGKNIESPEGITLQELVSQHMMDSEQPPVVAAKVDNRMRADLCS